ncbi:major facilitator superfamily domain-containing protein [Tricladium varicosporioides]|nr:major facilitator superfamily domain-containing protein [Hymenoscyphus varicosporioides]
MPPVTSDKKIFAGESKNVSRNSLSVVDGSVDLEELDNSGKVKGAFLGSNRQHAFSSAVSLDYWQDIYEKAKYEGRHRFDPQLSWSPSEESRLLRKLDMRIMLWVWIMFSSLDLVRRNINRAVSDKLLPELGMNTNDFNNGQTIYFFAFLAAELPGGLISKKFGPDVMTPISITLWGLICSCQCLIKSRTGYYVTRALLGLSQGGFIPEMVLYLSYFYKTNELPMRLSVFWTAIPLTQIIGSLLAGGFLEMRGISGWSGWQWLFLVEGLMSIGVGLCTFFVMPASVTETSKILGGKASWLHGKNGWFTPREEAILVNRILRDDPTKGDMNNRQHVSLHGLWLALKDYDLWPVYILGVLAYMPYQPTASYLSLTLTTLGYTVFEANMLAIPGFVLFFVNILFIVWLSEKLNERLLISTWSNIWMLPFFIGLVAIPKSAGPWIRYTLLTGVNGIPYTHAILVGMISRNSNSVGTRAVCAALYNMCYQFGSISAANVYRNDDKPYYYHGNKVLLSIVSVNIILFVLAKLYYIKRNQMKDRVWTSLSEEEKTAYLATTKDTGSRRLNVRFVH